MPFITVEILRGRTLEQRRQFVAEITAAAVEMLGSSAEQVRIRIIQIDPADLARDGQLAIDQPSKWFTPNN